MDSHDPDVAGGFLARGATWLCAVHFGYNEGGYSGSSRASHGLPNRVDVSFCAAVMQGGSTVAQLASLRRLC